MADWPLTTGSSRACSRAHSSHGQPQLGVNCIGVLRLYTTYTCACLSCWCQGVCGHNQTRGGSGQKERRCKNVAGPPLPPTHQHIPLTCALPRAAGCTHHQRCTLLHAQVFGCASSSIVNPDWCWERHAVSHPKPPSAWQQLATPQQHARLPMHTKSHLTLAHQAGITTTPPLFTLTWALRNWGLRISRPSDHTVTPFTPFGPWILALGPPGGAHTPPAHHTCHTS